jgi:hypothetical protein
MVTTDNYKSILFELGFKEVNGLFINNKYSIIGKKLINKDSILFSFNNTEEKIIIDDDFRGKVCDILNFFFRNKISNILNKISQQTYN